MNISGHKPQWTCLYYLNGQGNLREEQTRHLTRLHNEGASEDVCVVADLYRSDWKLSPKTFLHWVDEKLGLQKGIAQQVTEDWRGRATFVVRNPQDPQSQTLRIGGSSVDGDQPSDWKVLKNFLVESMEKFPAEHFALTVSSHGSTEHILTDRSGGKMSFEDLNRAISEAEQESGRDIELLTLEACKVGASPAIAELQKTVPYIIASPELVPAGEAPHASVIHQLKQNPEMSAQQLAQETVQAFQSKIPEMRLFQA